MSAPARAQRFRNYADDTRATVHELVSEFFPEPLRF
jgi:hypothetical protein